PEDLEAIRNGVGVPDEFRAQVADFVLPERMNYKQDWAQGDEMIDEMMTPEWRQKYADDFGGGYAFSWFILDHVGFRVNPRRRAMGYHVVYDYFRAKLERYTPPQDKLYWHFHPVSFTYEAHKTSNNFSFTNEHL